MENKNGDSGQPCTMPENCRFQSDPQLSILTKKERSVYIAPIIPTRYSGIPKRRKQCNKQSRTILSNAFAHSKTTTEINYLTL